ncbi:hypothetical protein PVAP13_2NG617800 [Panicum virgatum]|uniref:Peptidyl-prolyl cis-trans isomerase n=1 Tax=Panicum virgatum TaxID=38727 RepID=A0A8T0VSS1_PANVG|nr:hypothetical protein PVAP13_2NG617800 [Panicum virgatum]
MLGLRARAAAQLPCPSSSPSSAPATSLARFARLTPLAALAPLASAPPPPRARASLSARWKWNAPSRLGGTGTSSRPTTRGADLSDLAVEHSLCPSKENGGMLGWVRKGQMVPEFEEAAFSAPLNKVVRCKTKFGWHLLQVLAERDQCILQDIDPEELHTKMQDPSFLEEAQLIDVREPDEVAKASLPGFKVLPLRQFGTWGPVMTDEFNPQKDTYVLCHHGMRSMQVAKWLQSQGFKKVYNVAGGIHAYAVKADSSVPTY